MPTPWSGGWFLVQQFYNSLGNESRCLLDSAASGRFMQLEVPRALEVIEEIAIHSAQYGNPRGFADRGVKHEMNSIEQLTAQLTALHHKLDNIQIASSQSTQHASVAAMSAQSANVCNSCGMQGHYAQECRSSIEQCNAFQSYKQNNPYSNSYNEGYKNNPLLSYRSTNVQNPHQIQHPPPP